MIRLIVVMLLWTSWGHALELTEKVIDREFEKGAPTLDRIESQFLASKQKATSLGEKFGLNLTGSALYQRSQEKSFYEQDVILSPLTNFNIGVNKQLKYGVNLGLIGNVDQVSSRYFSQATASTVALDFSVDLYKDIFGRLSRNELKGAFYGLQKAAYQKEIDQTIFRQGLKKVYWSLVANNESLRISEVLLQTAKRQLVDAKKRFSDAVADSGEVARYESQVASRKASIIGLEYQKENYLQQLKELLPGFAEKELSIGKYDIDKTIGDVMECTLLISSQSQAPMNFTLYDEILELGTKEFQSNKKVAQGYSRPDIRLSSQYLFSSKEFGYRDAFDGLTDGAKGKYQVGISVKIPIGGSKSDTRDVLVELEKRKYLAEHNELFAKVRAYHKQTVKSISLLNQVAQEQKINSEKLEHSLKVTKKKYDQARISVGDLIREQDSFFASKLDEVQTKLLIISTLLDYFSVYTQTPCSINRK